MIGTEIVFSILQMFFQLPFAFVIEFRYICNKKACITNKFISTKENNLLRLIGIRQLVVCQFNFTVIYRLLKQKESLWTILEICFIDDKCLHAHHRNIYFYLIYFYLLHYQENLYKKPEVIRIFNSSFSSLPFFFFVLRVPDGR